MKMRKSMKMRSISNDEYVFGSTIRDGPKEDEVKRRKSIAKKMIKEAIDHNSPFKDFLEANHLYGKYVSSAVKYCTEIREDPSVIAYAITHRKDIRRIINETLIWSKTNQGTSFWSNVYNMAENIE